ncbi:sodium:solute symporter family transporter [Aneurinibacillus tyrosinisolvens]|uniref:sodium:solute symporter family transporter n=1 Tax=Aneurinibacillus tyrosinisolvens TaxID=1443435 RepID=UPI00063F43FC|nr:hypothetical protein [Aneurinibacillus tyrosinisolvens]
MSFQTIGILVVLVLGFIWAFIGIKVAKKVEKADDYMVGGRNVGVAFGAATLLATWVTGNTVLAAAEMSYSTGILGTIGYALTGGLGVLAFAPLAKKIRISMPQGRTVGDFFRHRFDKKNYYLFLIMLLIWDIGWLLTQGLGAGVLLESIFGIPFHTGLILTIGIVTLYVTAGGMLSVLGTDFMQTLLILAILFIFPAWVFSNAGFADVYTNIIHLAPDKMNLALPAGLLFCVVGPIMGIGEVFMDNTFWQRVFSLRPDKTKQTFIYAGLGWMFVPIAIGCLAFVAIGTGMKVDHPDAVAPLVVGHYAGKLGSVLFLSLVWACIASTVAALLNAVSAIFINDVYQVHINPNATDKQLIKVGKAVTVLAAVIAIAVAWSKPNSMMGLLLLLGVINAAYIFPITLGLFWSKTNRHGAFLGALLGSIIGLFIYGNGGFDLIFTKIQITTISWGGAFQGIIVGGLISLLFTVGVSLIQPERFNFRRLRNFESKEENIAEDKAKVLA